MEEDQTGDWEQGGGNKWHEAEGHKAEGHGTDHADGEGDSAVKTDTNPVDQQCSSAFSADHLTQA